MERGEKEREGEGKEEERETGGEGKGGEGKQIAMLTFANKYLIYERLLGSVLIYHPPRY